MGILDTLRTLLGLGGASSDEQRETTVSVEREARTETESAVKGAETTTDEPVAAGTDASASTESLVEEETQPTDSAESAEATGPGAGDVETELDTAASESRGETTGEHEAEHEGPEPESVEVIKGIGPAYAERLSNVDVDTVAELAAADADELAEAIDLSAKRVGRWIERARDH
ncbi:MAG: helix-hairpin-helix domain-containing protein [Haloplanus sp.]